MNIVVVGGGLGGLAVGIAARRAGHEVVVLERAGGPSEVPTGITLWPFAIHALAALGLGHDVISGIGAPLERLISLASDGRRLSELDITPLHPSAKAYDVDRAKLQAALVATLGAEHVRYGARCIGVSTTATAATARLDNGSEVEGELLIGADGVHSVVRSHVASGVSATRPDVGVWRGTLTLDQGVVPAGAHVRVYGAAGVFGVARLDEQRTRFYAGGHLRPDEEPGREALEARFGGWCEPASTAIAASADEELLFNDTPHIPRLSRWVRGRVALLGDAAHAALPTLGASGGLAVADAVAIGNALGREADDLRAFAAYARERQPIGRRLQWEARVLGLAEMSTRPRAARLRNRILAPSTTALQRRAMAHVVRGAERPVFVDLLGRRPSREEPLAPWRGWRCRPAQR